MLEVDYSCNDLNFFFMKKAYQLAKSIKGSCSPNPAVGCVIVKNSTILAEGKTQKAGLDHAEIDAIKKLSYKSLKNATMYVTLEPCCIKQKTNACTKAIIHSGIQEVFIGSVDFNPKIQGNGIKILRNSGIKVHYGIFKNLEKKIQTLNEDFNYFIQNNKPFTIAKYAMSLDGKIAFESGFSKWISGEKSRFIVQKIRNQVDAILVGKNTIIQDNPHLNVRIPNKWKDPLRIVLDSYGKTPLNSQIIQDDLATLFVLKEDPFKTTNDKSFLKQKNEFWINFIQQKKNKKIIFDPDSSKSNINLSWLLDTLAKMNITSILIEGGGEIFSSFIQENKIQKIICFLSLEKIIGISGKFPMQISDALNSYKENQFILLKDSKIKKLDNDIMISTYIKYNYEDYAKY